MECLRSLLEQLHNGYGRFPTVQTLRSHAANQSALLKDLRSLILSQRRTFIILDGIDEAQDQDKVMELLSTLANEELENLHLLISSRPESKNIQRLDPMMITTLSIEAQAFNEDISIYIEHYFHISATTKIWDDSVKRETRDWLVNKPMEGTLATTFTSTHTTLAKTLTQISLDYFLPCTSGALS